MKIVVADKISERGLEILRQPGWEVVTPEKAALEAELAAADALVVRSATRVTAPLLEQAARLRVVGRAGVGVDNIDLDAATRRGVLVMSTPGGNAVSVAEHTFALLLALARHVPRLDAAIHAGRWEKGTSAGVELRGKTLGLIGLGRIGGEVARRANAFEMRVLAYDPYISERVAQEAAVELVPLADLLGRSDFVSLHAAISPATERMINATTLAQMKRGARLINAARGELVEEAALAAALRSGPGRVRRRAAPRFSVDGAAQRHRHTPRGRLDRRSARGSGHAHRATGERFSCRRNSAQRRESPAAFRRAISSRAPVSGSGGAIGLARRASGGRPAGASAHLLRGRACRTGHAYLAQRGASGSAQHGSRRKSESGERRRGRGCARPSGRGAHAPPGTRFP